MIMSAAPPARRTVTETWQACSASGRKTTSFFAAFLFFSLFCSLPYFAVVEKHDQYTLCHRQPQTFEIPNLHFIKLLFVVPTTLRQHPNLPLYPINVFPAVLCFSQTLIVFLKL